MNTCTEIRLKESRARAKPPCLMGRTSTQNTFPERNPYKVITVKPGRSGPHAGVRELSPGYLPFLISFSHLNRYTAASRGLFGRAVPLVWTTDGGDHKQ